MLALAICPGDSHLEDFLLGKLEEPEIDAVQQHVAVCALCCSRIDTLDLRDALVEVMQEVSTLKPAEESVVVNTWIGQLRLLQQTPTETTPGRDGPQTGDGKVAQAPNTGAGEEWDEDPFEQILGLLSPGQGSDELGRLGHYGIRCKLGAGGMGVVYRADDTQLDRPVALKLMRPVLAASTTARQRFLREAKAVAAVKHPHIVTIFQVGEEQGVPFLAMELLEGESLEIRLARQGPLPIVEGLRIGREIAEGLAAAHERGLVHRDVKPANIFLENHRTVKILDFGLARGVKDTDHLTPNGTIVGTPAYMSPEQAAHAHSDPRGDLFSLGCVLYRMTTGTLPFRGGDALSTLFALANVKPAPPRAINADVPQHLSDLIMRLLAKEPAARPGSAKNVADRLRELEHLSGPAISALAGNAREKELAAAKEKQPGPATSAIPVRRGLSMRWLVAGALLLAAAGGGFALCQLIFNTLQGTLIVEIDDPKIEARFKDGVLQLYGADGQIRYSLKPGEHDKTLPAGHYLIRLTGADGLSVDTKEFTLKRGDTVTVRVSLQPPVLPENKTENTKTAEPDLDHPKIKFGKIIVDNNHDHNVTFRLYHANRLDVVFATWNLSPNTTEVLHVDGKEFAIGGDWLIQVQFMEELKSQLQLVYKVGTYSDGAWRLKSLEVLQGSDPDRLLAEQVLKLSGTVEIESSVGKTRLANLANLGDLPKFHLSLVDLVNTETGVTNDLLKQLALLPRLKTFNARNTPIGDSGLGQFKNAKGLEGLWAENCSLTNSGLKYLVGMSELRDLNLNGNPKITDAGLQHVGSLKKLQILRLSNTNLTDKGLRHLADLQELRLLEIHGVEGITGSGFEHLRGLQKLEEIHAGWSSLGKVTQVDNADLAHLVGLPLTNLSLWKTRVTDAGVIHLKQMKKLQHLWLEGTKVSAAGIAELRAALPECKIYAD
jgi:eukaryotic-like serine/threonine-protein kinase